MNKKLLRQQARRKRDSLNWLEIQGKSHEISQRLLLMPEYQKAKTVLFYLSFNNEVDTQGIINNAWQQRKKVLVPICQTATKNLLLSEFRSFSELTSGTWNIPEPKKEYVRPFPPSQVDLAIIPGLAFDLQGNRLGYGAGYYDRFLPTLPSSCPKIALSYDLTMLEFLPTEEHDIPMDYIVTETTIHRITK